MQHSKIKLSFPALSRDRKRQFNVSKTVYILSSWFKNRDSRDIAITKMKILFCLFHFRKIPNCVDINYFGTIFFKNKIAV